MQTIILWLSTEVIHHTLMLHYSRIAVDVREKIKIFFFHNFKKIKFFKKIILTPNFKKYYKYDMEGKYSKSSEIFYNIQ